MKALNEFVLIELLAEETKKIGAIELPNSKKPLREAKIISVSENCKNKNIKDGDIVFVNNSVCEWALDEEKNLYFVNENALFGVK